MKKNYNIILSIIIVLASVILFISNLNRTKIIEGTSNNVILIGLDGVSYKNLNNYILSNVSTNTQQNIITNKKILTDVIDSGNAWREVIYGKKNGVVQNNGYTSNNAKGNSIFEKLKKINKKTAFFYNWYAMDPNFYSLSNQKTWGVLSTLAGKSIDKQFDQDINLKDTYDGKNKMSSITQDYYYKKHFNSELPEVNIKNYINHLNKIGMETNFNNSKKAIEEKFNFIFHYDTTADDLGHGNFNTKNNNEKSKILRGIYEIYSNWLDYYFSLDKNKWTVIVLTDHGRCQNGIDHKNCSEAYESWVLSNKKVTNFTSYKQTSTAIIEHMRN